MRPTKNASILGIAAVSLLLISACATDNTFRPTGASRAEGIVQLSYNYDLSDRPDLDWHSAENIAEERCINWGYSSAVKAGNGQQACLAQDVFGRCRSFQVNVNYHCTDTYTSQ